MDYEALRFYLEVLIFVSNIGLWVWNFWGTKSKVMSDKVAAQDKRITDLSTDFATKVAAEVVALGARIDVARNDSSNAIALLDGRVDNHSEQLGRMDERLKHMPDAEELEKTNGELKALLQASAAQQRQLDAIQLALRSIETFLRDNR